MNRAVSLLIALGVFLVGCGESRVDYRSPESGTRYYPPPAAFRDVSLELGERMPQELRTPQVDLVFATTRRPVAAKDGGVPNFGDEPDGALHLGSLSMTIGPRGTTWDDLLDWARLNEYQIPPVRVELTRLDRFGFAGVGTGATAPDARLLASLEPHYAHGGRRVLLFVHGYNTTFAEAAATLACMHHHQGRRGAAVLFSWPAGTEVFRYLHERDLARDSTNALARLISLLSGPGKVERIDCLVNSTGAAMLFGALHQLADTIGRDALPTLRLGNVVLASPDVALQEFVDDDLALLAAATRHTVVYSNRDDRALGLSGWWYDGLRLGRVEQLDDHLRSGLLAQREHVELVDITDLPGPKDADGFTKHGAWYANPLVVTDALLSLMRGAPATERGLKLTDDGLIWHIPRDYARIAANEIARLLQETR